MTSAEPLASPRRWRTKVRSSSLKVYHRISSSRLEAALKGMGSCIGDPLFETHIGQEFGLDQFAAAMSYEGQSGAKAVFTP